MDGKVNVLAVARDANYDIVAVSTTTGVTPPRVRQSKRR
jgi:hypothetical protein